MWNKKCLTAACIWLKTLSAVSFQSKDKPQRTVFESTGPWIDFAVEGLIKSRVSESNLAFPMCSAAEEVRTWTCFVS